MATGLGSVNEGNLAQAIATLASGTPVLALSATALNFGNVAIGSSKSLQVTATNVGTGALKFTEIVLTSADYQVSGCGATILPAQSCTLTFVFSPKFSFTDSYYASLETNTSTLFYEVTLNGTGVTTKAPTLSSTVLSFGTQKVGVGSGTQSVTITNTTGASMSINTISVVGVDPADFSQTNNCGSALGVNATCSISVTFNPGSAGSRPATLSISDTAPGSPQTVSLHGTGIAGPNGFAVWRPTNGIWYVLNVNAVSQYPSPSIQQQWGLPGDTPVPGDYDGDGQSDFAVWRPFNVTWYTLYRSATSQYPIPSREQAFGLPDDNPVPGDYDGDGKTDFAVWRPSNGSWYIIPSSNPSSPIVQQWGLPGDIPVPGDYDGDGITDLAVWRPSNGTWYIIPSSNPSTPIIQQWGLLGDVPLVGHFNNDGKADFAVWRPSNGTWFILYSTATAQWPNPSVQQQWGLPGDIPVIGDFNGDGQIDFAVWRPSNGTWYVLYNTAVSQYPNPSLEQQWGLQGDTPVIFR